MDALSPALPTHVCDGVVYLFFLDPFDPNTISPEYLISRVARAVVMALIWKLNPIDGCISSGTLVILRPPSNFLSLWPPIPGVFLPLLFQSPLLSCSLPEIRWQSSDRHMTWIPMSSPKLDLNAAHLSIMQAPFIR
ncbi:hypothetical protein AB1N83_012457 [Pleurotus pulmonarius]